MLKLFINEKLPLLRQIIDDSKDLIKYYQCCESDISIDELTYWAKNVYNITEETQLINQTEEQLILNGLYVNVLYMTIFSITTRPVEKLKYLIGLSLLHTFAEPIKLYLKTDFYKEEIIYGISEIFYILQQKHLISIDIASDMSILQRNSTKQLTKLRCKQLQQDIDAFITNQQDEDQYSLILRFYDRQIDMSAFSNLNLTTIIIIDLRAFDIDQLKLSQVRQLILRNVQWSENSSQQLKNLEKLSLDIISGIKSKDFFGLVNLTHISLSSVHNIPEVLTYLDGTELLYLNLWNIKLSPDVFLVDKFCKCKDFIIRGCQLCQLTFKNCLDNVESLIVCQARENSYQSKITFCGVKFYDFIRVINVPAGSYEFINLNSCKSLATVHTSEVTPPVLCRKSHKQYIQLESKVFSLHFDSLSVQELQTLIQSVFLLAKNFLAYKLLETKFLLFQAFVFSLQQ